jgi:hypothetical protein
VENRAGQELFSVALKAGLLLFYVITKGRAATFSDIEIFLVQHITDTGQLYRIQIERRLFTQPK